RSRSRSLLRQRAPASPRRTRRSRRGPARTAGVSRRARLELTMTPPRDPSAAAHPLRVLSPEDEEMPDPNVRATPAEQRLAEFRSRFLAIEAEVGKLIVGHRSVLRKLLAAFFAGGHVLLEGVPGLGKTLIVRSVATALGLSFKRIQFTPDLMPADII